MEQVDPENTSRRCSHCGFTHPDNRGVGEELNRRGASATTLCGRTHRRVRRLD
ncbi:hypothetical protein [Halogeometricum borinquense]|uniref:hypothetical protein n=1 Tax=Halogeometricum borinquense TaxID=60847 RepID=UPI00341D69E0